jgi:integrase
MDMLMAKSANNSMPAGPITMASLNAELERHFEGRPAARPMRRVMHMVTDDLEASTVDQLDDDFVRRFYAHVDKTLADRGEGYRHSLKMMFNRLCRLAHKWELLIILPALAKLPQPDDLPRSKPAPPTLAHVKALLDYLAPCAVTWEGYRLLSAVATIVWTGLLRDEALRLRVEDVDLETGRIRVRRREKMRRTRLPSVVLIPDELRPILAGWIPLTRSNLVFPGNWRMGPWSPHSGPTCADTALKEACRAAGLPHMTFDGLRRFFIANARPAIRGLEMGTVPPGPIQDDPQQLLPRGGGEGPRPRRPNHRRPELATYAPDPVPAIKLGARGAARIRGIDMGVLRPAPYRALKLLRNAWPGGLSKEEMTRKYGGESWRQALMRLRKNPTWRSAIGFPEKGHRGIKSDLYRILPW